MALHLGRRQRAGHVGQRFRQCRGRCRVALFGVLRPRCQSGRRRPRGLRRIDRLRLRLALGLVRTGSRLRQRHAIALEPAIDGRIFDLQRGARHRRRIDRPRFHVERARIEIDRLGAERLGHRRADRAHKAECRDVNGAERRGDQVVAPAVGNARLSREERREVLIADRGRRERDAESAEPERPRQRPRRPGTQRNHHPSRARSLSDASPIQQTSP